jgi:hypothetical protein
VEFQSIIRDVVGGKQMQGEDNRGKTMGRKLWTKRKKKIKQSKKEAGGK